MAKKSYTDTQINDALYKAYKKYMKSDMSPETFIGKLECLKMMVCEDIKEMARMRASAMSELGEVLSDIMGGDDDAD